MPPASASPQHRIQLSDDLFLAPDVPRLSSGSKPGYYETSEYLIGKVAVAVIFLESNGAVDPNFEDWTADEISRVIYEISVALRWWEAQNPSAQVSFTGLTVRVPTSYEPILRPSTHEGLWISEAMAYLGYPGADYKQQVRDYNNDLRRGVPMRTDSGTVSIRADWSFVIFVVDSSRDPDGKFADGKSAYAYLGGPFLVLTYDNGGWGIDNMDFVAAHEIGHIFYATDEYNGITEYSGYLNAPDCEGSYSLMGRPILGFIPVWRLSECTKLQVGWRDTDGDGILDIVDTFPKTTLISVPPYLTDATVHTYRGEVEEIPYPNRNPFGTGRSVTINTIRSVKFRVDGGPWLTATPTDGSFDDVHEEFSFMATNLPVGLHTVEVYSVNSVNNIEAPWVKHTFTVTLIIIDQSVVSGWRVDVGSVQKVSFRALWAHDLSPVRSGMIFINGTAYMTGSDGWVNLFVSSSQVGRQIWTVTGVRVGDIARFRQTAPSPTIIWDRLVVNFKGVDDDRRDIGTIGEIRFRLRSEYDGALVQSGLVRINGTLANWDPINSWWKITFTLNAVGKRNFVISSAHWAAYGITALNPAVTMNATSIIWDRIKTTFYGVSDDRADVGTTQQVRVRLVLDFDNTPLGPLDIVRINGTPASFDPINGWFYINYAQSVVGKKVFAVSFAFQSSYGITAFIETQTLPSIIWDAIEAFGYGVSKSRADVGSSVTFWWQLRYKYDGVVFDPSKGSVTIGGSAAIWNSANLRWELAVVLPSTPQLITRSLGLVDKTYGLTVVIGITSQSVIADRLEVFDYGVSDNRLNVGEFAIIWVKLRYDYDDVVFDNTRGSVSIGGVPARWDPINLRWYITQSRNSVQKVSYLSPSSFTDNTYGLTAITGSVTQSVIWDRIKTTWYGVSNIREDVGTPQQIRVKLVLEYDNTPLGFGDTVYINGTLASFDAINGWFYITYAQSMVGKKVFAVSSASQASFGINVFIEAATPPSIIWDRVIVTLSVPNPRIGVGTPCSIIKSGIYEYDGAVFRGSISLNDTETKGTVGRYSYRALRISDPTYGLTAFTTNVVQCIFDRIQIVITALQERVEVGTKAPLTWTASYEYDGAVFRGEVTLSEELVKRSVGKVSYTVKDVHDPLYGIKSFVSNTVHVIFDRIAVDIQTETIIPGSIKPLVRLTYQFDGAPVLDASVTINGIDAINLGDGLYEVRIPTLSPYATYHVEVNRPGFSTLRTSGSVFVLGNLLLITVLIASVSIIVVRYYFAKGSSKL